MTKKHRIRLVDPQGGRSPTAGSASRQDRGRWSSRRKTEVVLRILRGETLDALSRELGVSPGRLAEWRDEAIAAMQAGLQSCEPTTATVSSTTSRPRSATRFCLTDPEASGTAG